MKFKDWNENILKDKNWNPPVNKSIFLEEQLHPLSEIPLVKNASGKYDATLILQNLKDTQETETIQRISFLYHINRSKIMPVQTKFPRLGALTPLALYAHKLYNDITYESWDKSSPHLKYFLGRNLEGILTIKEPITLLHADILALRAKALTYASGAKAGEMAELTSNKFNATELIYKKLTCGGSKAKNENIGRMLLQLWLANAAVRQEGVMILDPFSWDKVPEAIDEVVKVPEKREIDKWWDII